MLWYGWTLTTILIAAALGIIAMLIPERITKKIPLWLIWLFPILAVPYVVYSLSLSAAKASTECMANHSKAFLPARLGRAA